MESINEALEYYQKSEPHLKTQVINKLNRLSEITKYSMSGITEDYRAQIDDDIAEFKKNPDNYTTEHIKEQQDKAIAAAKAEYQDKLNALDLERRTLETEVKDVLQESITVYQLNNDINSGDMLVLQNQLKSELNQINLNGMNGGKQLLEHFDNNIKLAKHDKQHGRTLAALLYMYDEKLDQLEDNEYYKSYFTAFTHELYDTIHTDRYKSDKITLDHIKSAHGSSVTSVPLKITQDDVDRKMKDFITGLAQERRLAGLRVKM